MGETDRRRPLGRPKRRWEDNTKMDFKETGVCDTCGGGTREYRVLVEETDRRRPLGRPKGRWEDNTKIDFQEIGACDTCAGGTREYRVLGGETDRRPLGRPRHRRIILKWIFKK